jgi:hypothetical protein
MNECGRPTTENEIEVKPEMIEADIECLARYRYDLGNEEKVVVEIFRAMISATQGAQSASRRLP